jgi:hypothetical protein
LNQDEASLLSWKKDLLISNKNISTTVFQNWVETNNNSSSSSSSSSSSGGPCGWSGVQCGIWQGQTRVIGLNLTFYNLTGPLPSQGIANLTALSSLIFAQNRFNGSIPPELGNLTNLQVIF